MMLVYFFHFSICTTYTNNSSAAFYIIIHLGPSLLKVQNLLLGSIQYHVFGSFDTSLSHQLHWMLIVKAWIGLSAIMLKTQDNVDPSFVSWGLRSDLFCKPLGLSGAGVKIRFRSPAKFGCSVEVFSGRAEGDTSSLLTENCHCCYFSLCRSGQIPPWH